MNPNLNVEKLIEDMDLDHKALAEYLFPDNQYATMALKRVLKGEALLNSDQVVRLSEFTGIPIEKLFGGKWGSYSKADSPEIIVYERDSYKAELNTRTWTTNLMDKNSEFKETLIHGPNLILKDYLAELDAVINKQS